MKRHLNNFNIGLEAIKINKLKSALTTLGLIFGVASVIVMLSIGEGAKKEILDQMKYIGVNNIWIKAASPSNNINSAVSDDVKNSDLSYSDFESIKKILGGITQKITTVYSYKTQIQRNRVIKPVNVYGVDASYFDIFNLGLFSGTFFNEIHEKYGLPVCVISSTLASEIFTKTDPINKYVKCDNVWLLVIGVYKSRKMNLFSDNDNDHIEFSGNDIYIPAKTMLMRFGNSTNPSFDTKSVFQKFNDLMNHRQDKPIKLPSFESIIVQLKKSDQLSEVIPIIDRILSKRHSDNKNFVVYSPQLLLKQQQHTKDIFNAVLAVIAGISLLVGGIGIMNIMYASVMERIREIGTRMAVGASKNDILEQFLAEAIIISCSGGLTGIIIGYILSKITTHVADVLTIITVPSVLIAFAVSVSVGIIFGLSPARSAALKDPIESLRNF